MDQPRTDQPRTARLPDPAADSRPDPGSPTSLTGAHQPEAVPVDPSVAGTVLGGRYRVGECIGAGAMGVVWTAWDRVLRRTVAVKHLVGSASTRRADPADDAAARLARVRALREGRIAARVVHPRAIAVFDVIVPPGEREAPWLVMEYLPSRSLAAIIAEDGPVDPADAARIGAQIADALAAVHEAGIVHGDVKPANVLVGEAVVKITDFGVSRASWDTTSTGGGAVAGTPGYVAPEVARGEDPTPASDVFSLGATLYAAVENELVCGRRTNSLAVLHALAGGDLRPPARAGVLDAPLAAMLAIEPSQRPNMRALHRMLRSVQTTPLSAEDSADGTDDAPGTADGRVHDTIAARPELPAPRTPSSRFPASHTSGQPARPGSSGRAGGDPAASRRIPEPTRPSLLAAPSLPSESGAGSTPSAPSPTASELPADRRRPRRRRPEGSVRVVVAAAVAAIALGVVGGVTIATTQPGLLSRSTGTAAAPTGARPAPAPSPGAASGPSAVAPGPSSGASGSGTSGPSSTSSPGDPGASVSADDVRSTIAGYYGALPGDLDTAWSTLSDDARGESGGFAGYARFWHGISAVSVGDVRVDGTAGTADITFVTTDGRISRETYRFEIGRATDGRLRIESARRTASSI